MRTLLAISLAIFLWVPSAAAQTVAEACETLSKITVGQWVEYKITSANPNAPAQGRFAIVDTEEVDGEEYYWHEMKMSTAMGDMVMQMLVESYPYDVADIRSAVMKMGTQPAMRVPDQMMTMMQSQGVSDPAMEIVDQCGSAELIGRESVTVPAGTFETMHLRVSESRGTSDIWVSLDIPFGVVKLAGAGGEEIVLIGHGRDATSSIAQRPR